MKRLLVYTFCMLALLTGTGARADQITLANGRTIEGRIISETHRYVELETGGFVTKLSRDSITAIERAAEYKNTLLAAEAALKRREPVDAIELLFEARRQGASEEAIHDILDRLNGGIAGAIHTANARERGAIRRSIRALMEEDFLTSRTLFFASQNFFKLDDWESSAEALEQIATEDIQSDPPMRRWALELMRQLVRRRLARDDFEGAIEYVERMRRITGSEGHPNIPLAHLARSAAARERGDYEQALRIIAEDLSTTVPEIARNRAIYTIEKMKRWAENTRRFSEAREMLAPISDVYPILHASARGFLVELEARMLIGNAEPKTAMELLESIGESERSSEMERLYNQAYHEYQMGIMEESDPLALLKHAQWAMDHGLVDEAILIFEKTRQNPNLRDVSDQFLTNARRVRDTRLMEEARDLYSEGRMVEVLDRTQGLLTNPDLGSRLSEEARRLDQLARRSLNREVESRGPRAEVFFQRADRAFILQNYEESLSLLNLILSQYAETPAASRAAALLPQVIRGLELAYLEGRQDSLPELPRKITAEQMQKYDRLDEEVRGLIEAMEDRGNAGRE